MYILGVVTYILGVVMYVLGVVTYVLNKRRGKTWERG